VKVQRASTGLDVHARSVVGCALDRETSEVFQRRLTPDYREVLGWLGDLPGPVAVTYEAGPTGFGARALIRTGIACQVAAPSKLQRPAGIGSRPMPAMPCIWPGCCIWVRSWRSRFPPSPRRRRGIWYGHGRTVAGI
jgi:hypothetical protein